MNKFKFDFEEHEIDIETDKKITKKEKNFLKDVYNYIDPNKDELFYPQEKIAEFLSADEENDIFLEKLMRKRVNITVYKKESKDKIYFISFPFFDFYIKKENEYMFTLSKGIEFIKKNNIFGEINIFSNVLFKEQGSKKIYFEILKNKNKGSFIQKIDYLKEILGIGSENYERFYDFEKIVLKPIVEDINKYTDYSLQYEKIKKGMGLTCKIQEVKFSFYHKKFNNISEETDKMINRLVGKVDSIVLITKFIEKNILNNGFEYVKNNLEWVLENGKTPLDNLIEQALNENLYSKTKAKNYILEVDIKEKFNHIFIFESRIYKELRKCNFYYNYDFLKVLYKLKEDEVLKYEDENFKIEVLYCGKLKEGSIKIYKKEDVNSME